MDGKTEREAAAIEHVEEYVTDMLLSMADMSERVGSDYADILRAVAKPQRREARSRRDGSEAVL